MAVNTNRFLPSSRGGALATTRPTATLVPYKKPAGGALVKQPAPDDEGDTKPSLEEDVAAISEQPTAALLGVIPEKREVG